MAAAGVLSMENARERAKLLDYQDPLQSLRIEFIIPSKADLNRSHLWHDDRSTSEPCIYLCGNSLGLQPRAASRYVESHLRTWANKGVLGHFERLEDATSDPWLDIDATAARDMAKIVGAEGSEVAIMGTLTANLHLLMASFYRPTKKRYKILIESKAFPSDYFAIESQLQMNGFDPASDMIQINSGPGRTCLSIQDIKDAIDEHASDAALILLPGVQFYTGQLLPIEEVTAYAHRAGLVVGWDLAHAVGNVPLELHNWKPDFAVWCSYKYLNAGPGAIAGVFVHEKHGRIDESQKDSIDGESQKQLSYRLRLCGWWGADKNSRFKMDNRFIPIPGAGGYQLSNPSALDMAALSASLSVFSQTSMQALRAKSVLLTGLLLELLALLPEREHWNIITPLKEEERGAQISIKLQEGLLESVMRVLRREGVIVDERRPDVIRVAPAPLYNSFGDVWNFIEIFGNAVRVAVKERTQQK